MSEDGELISRSSAQLDSVTVLQMVNGFLGREPALSECCWSATSEAHGSKLGSADLQDIA